jgi:hypothetical protein
MIASGRDMFGHRPANLTQIVPVESGLEPTISGVWNTWPMHRVKGNTASSTSTASRRAGNVDAEFDQHHPDVVVGSSRGGAVAMNIDAGAAPLVLLCPAWTNRR